MEVSLKDYMAGRKAILFANLMTVIWEQGPPTMIALSEDIKDDDVEDAIKMVKACGGEDTGQRWPNVNGEPEWHVYNFDDGTTILVTTSSLCEPGDYESPDTEDEDAAA